MLFYEHINAENTTNIYGERLCISFAATSCLIITNMFVVETIDNCVNEEIDNVLVFLWTFYKYYLQTDLFQFLSCYKITIYYDVLQPFKHIFIEHTWWRINVQ